LIGKAAIDGKKPYFVINSEKVVQRERELPVNKGIFNTFFEAKNLQKREMHRE